MITNKKLNSPEYHMDFLDYQMNLLRLSHMKEGYLPNIMD